MTRDIAPQAEKVTPLQQMWDVSEKRERIRERDAEKGRDTDGETGRETEAYSYVHMQRQSEMVGPAT